MAMRHQMLVSSSTWIQLNPWSEDTCKVVVRDSIARLHDMPVEPLVDALTEFHVNASDDDCPTTPRDLIMMLRLFTRWVRTFRTEHANSFGVISSGLDSLNDAETAVEEARLTLITKQKALEVKEAKVSLRVASAHRTL